jgi:hypothetical protein
LVETHKAAVDRVKADLKDLQKTLGIERGRVEELLVEDREWPLRTWRTRYLEHPLTSSIATRLIWRFSTGAQGETTAAIPLRDGFRTADNATFEPDPASLARLWHPIDATEAEVVEWRRFLMEHQLRQPFKQAFARSMPRPSQRTRRTSTRTGSGPHPPLPAGARADDGPAVGSNFLGPFDGGDTGLAKRDFPSHAIRAEFWHDAIIDEARVDVAWENCTTDQVRFLRLGGDEAVLPIREVPARVFSEAMRDVDPIVSVTSVGADRNWEDGGLNRLWAVRRLLQRVQHRRAHG